VFHDFFAHDFDAASNGRFLPHLAYGTYGISVYQKVPVKFHGTTWEIENGQKISLSLYELHHSQPQPRNREVLG